MGAQVTAADLTLPCPRCRAQLAFPRSSTGQSGQCPACRQTFAIVRRARWHRFVLGGIGTLVAGVSLAALSGRGGLFAAAPDDVANDPEHAPTQALEPEASVEVSHLLESVRDADVFRFVAPVTGRLSFVPEAEFPLALEVEGELGLPLATRQAQGGDGVDADVLAGAAVFLRVRSGAGATGPYAVRVEADGCGTVECARLVEVAGKTSWKGRLDRGDDRDGLRLRVSEGGALTVRARVSDGSEGRLALERLDESGGLVAASARPDPDEPDATQLFLTTESGVDIVLVVVCDGAGAAQGPLAYELEFAPVVDDVGNTPESAHVLDTDLMEYAPFSGRLETVGDRDVFAVAIESSGELEIELDPSEGNDFVPAVRLLDRWGTALPLREGSLGAFPWHADVVEGNTYFIEVGALGQGAGYELRVRRPTDDHGDVPEEATEVYLLDELLLSGSIEQHTDVDCFAVSFFGEGALRLLLEEDALVPRVDVLDEMGEVLASNDGSARVAERRCIALDPDSAQAADGFAYVRIRSSFFGALTGSYRVHVVQTSSADQGDRREEAQRIEIAASGPTLVEGDIEWSADEDWFEFAVSSSGRFSIGVRTPDSALDSRVALYASTGRLIAENDDALGSIDSALNLNLEAGAVYAVCVRSFGGSRGTYVLDVHSPSAEEGDDHGDDVLGATRLDLASGRAEVSGSIERVRDEDWFEFVAPGTTTLVIEMTAVEGSVLNSIVEFRAESGERIDWDSHSGKGFDARLEAEVVVGRTYYVCASAPPGGRHATGAYRLSVGP